MHTRQSNQIQSIIFKNSKQMFELLKIIVEIFISILNNLNLIKLINCHYSFTVLNI